MYKNDVATQPLQRLCVGDCNVSCSVSFCGTCRDGYYCFTVESSDEGGKKTGSNVFCSDDTAEQERWIQALINAGASFTENQNELVKDAHSFYEFKVSPAVLGVVLWAVAWAAVVWAVVWAVVEQ